MLLLDHLSESDKTYLLDKAALYLAEILAKQQMDEVVHRGQAALARRLGCSRQSVSKIMTEQRIGYSRVGKKGYQFTEAQVLEYLKSA